MATKSLSDLIGDINSRGNVVQDDTGHYSYQSGSGGISKNTITLSNEATLYAFYQETKAICPNPREGSQPEEAMPVSCYIISADRLSRTSVTLPYGQWTYIFVEPYAEIVFSFSFSYLYTKDECKDPDTGDWIEGRRYPNVSVCDVDYRQWTLTSDGIFTSELSSLTPSSPLNPPLPKCIWRLENGEITHKRFSEEVLPLHEPLPYCLWRSTPSERDYIFHRRLPDHLPPEPPEPVDVEPVKQRPYICIFSKYTQQNLFYTHGKAILHPTKCLITEELNGKYNLTIEHPIDNTGLWEYIRENNIIKALGQLFTIRLVKQSWNGNEGKVTATADHIFYHMADKWIPMGSSITTNLLSVQALIDVAQTYVRASTHYEGEVIYGFHQVVDTDMAYPGYYINGEWIPDLDFNASHWADLQTGINPVDFFMGSDSIISNVGGELYRDNFYFAITNRKLYSKDNAFELRVGKNVTGISRTIDMTNFVTAITAKNNYGTTIYQDVSPAHVRNTYGVEFAHPVIRDKYYSYDYPDTIPYETRYEYAEARLNRDKQRYMDEHVPPNIVYDIKLKDLKNAPEYESFLNQSDFTVGNTGYVYDERLSSSAIKLKVTRTVRNAITDEVEEVSFGKLQKLSS
jgi:hypothetical protein